MPRNNRRNAVVEVQAERVQQVPYPSVRNVLTDLIVNDDDVVPAVKREPQWVNRYYPIRNNGYVFLKYTEELTRRHVDIVLCDICNNVNIELNKEEVVKLRDALNNLLGDVNG